MVLLQKLISYKCKCLWWYCTDNNRQVEGIFQDLDIPWSKVGCFSSDGASVMVGRINGVATKLRELDPQMARIHCGLSLAVSQATDGIPYFTRFKANVKSLLSIILLSDTTVYERSFWWTTCQDHWMAQHSLAFSSKSSCNHYQNIWSSCCYSWQWSSTQCSCKSYSFNSQVCSHQCCNSWCPEVGWATQQTLSNTQCQLLYSQATSKHNHCWS